MPKPHYEKNIPAADTLMKSMRSMGYSFESAIADVIDNSISAKARNIHILFPVDPLKDIAVGIWDDGLGMDSDELFEAMRYGSSSAEAEREATDLGRFGLGLKSASLSQCRILTVICKKDNKVSAYSWDFNYIMESREWYVRKLSLSEIKELPYSHTMREMEHGTLVLWQDFDVISKSCDGQTFDRLMELKSSVDEYIGLIFHRYIASSNSKEKISISINNHKVRALDPFLESHPKVTTKKERTIAVNDSNGIEQLIKVKLFVLPFISDLTDKDKKLIGGVENLRTKQGFYIYRNKRLIIWGTWFNMKPKGELTKNARVRVDIPNTLDDIWSIDIKKQTASIPKRIQNQLKNIVIQALDISVTKQTHRGRKDSVDDSRDYIWDRMKTRGNNFYYVINRDNRLFQFVREKMSEEDFVYLDMLISEIEQNLPTHQLYIDKANDCVVIEEPDHRADGLFQIGITMIDAKKALDPIPVEEIISQLMASEPFCNYSELKERFINNYTENDQ